MMFWKVGDTLHFSPFRFMKGVIMNTLLLQWGKSLNVSVDIALVKKSIVLLIGIGLISVLAFMNKYFSTVSKIYFSTPIDLFLAM